MLKIGINIDIIKIMKPIVKWAGGKTQLLNTLMDMIPEEFNTYYEPFFGGGALFFKLEPENAVINDNNIQLMNLYTCIRDDSEKLITKLKVLQKSHLKIDDYYNIVRNRFNKCIVNKELSYKSASMLIYLNKAGYNGLFRTNSEGYYNVPTSGKKNLKLYDRKNFKEISELLKNTKIYSKDFEKVCAKAQRGDFVFFDSPYYNTFDTYQAGGFTKEDHERLKKLFDNLSKKGVKCMLTNSNEKYIKNLYNKYNITIVEVKRMINCDGNKRTGKEVIITNY